MEYLSDFIFMAVVAIALAILALCALVVLFKFWGRVRYLESELKLAQLHRDDLQRQLIDAKIGAQRVQNRRDFYATLLHKTLAFVAKRQHDALTEDEAAKLTEILRKVQQLPFK